MWLALLLIVSSAQEPENTEAREIRPDDGHPEAKLDVGEERGELGIKRQVEPVFPEEARKSGLSFGRCVVDLEVNAAGVPDKPQFVDCPDVFQKASAEALRQWRWHPEVGGDGLPRNANTRVIIDYRDASPTAALADPDPLSTPIGEFGTIQDARPQCVGHATIGADGRVLDKSANRLPDCIFEPTETASVSNKPLNVLATCTLSFVTDRGYAMKVKVHECPGAIRAAAGRNVRAWTWPWTPEAPVAYEMTLTFLSD